MLCLVLSLVLAVDSVFSGNSETLLATRASLQRFAREASPARLGRSSAPISTNFYKSLGDIQRSIKYAEAIVSWRPSPSYNNRSFLIGLRKAIVAAAKKGNYKIGREIFGYARVLEDQASLSRSRKRQKRASDDIIDYIKDKIGDSPFNQFFNIESGSTLSFILDTTGSMKEDILQVQEIAKTLASPGEGEDGTGFFTYLLTTFKDPDVGPVQSFDDKGEFLSSLEEISLSGGGDCDEVVMKGIVEGLFETEAYSPVFVFTDAGSKDLEERDTIVSLSQSLYSPIFFFLTPGPECFKDISDYEDLAEETSGQVFSIGKSEIYKLQNVVKSTGIGRSEIVSGDESTGERRMDKRSLTEYHVREFHVDNTVTSLVVSVYFKTPQGSCYLLSPSMVRILPTFGSATTNMLMYEIEDPQPGRWTLKATTNMGDKFTYKANTVSPTNIDFHFDLLTEFRGRDVPTNHAIPGELLKLQVDVLGGEESIRSNSSKVFLIDTSGNVISTVQTLKVSDDVSHIYDGQFVVPLQTFKVMLYGETIRGYPFTRSSQSSITPSYGKLETFATSSILAKKVLEPGATGKFYFKFTHFSETTRDFVVTFTNPGHIIETTSPLLLNGIRKKRSKIIRLQYNIPRSLPDGTEFRIALIVEGGNVKSGYVHTVLVSRLSGDI